MRTLDHVIGVCVFGVMVCGVAAFTPAPPASGGIVSEPAHSIGRFESDFSSEADGSIEIGRIGFSDHVRTKADSLGAAELARLSGYLRGDLEQALVAADWHGVAVQETVLDITILDVVPNRPTVLQIQEMDGAHYSAHGGGGAAISAELRAADGRLIASFAYDWFNTSSGDSAGDGVWTDTRTAFSQFAGALADSLGMAPMPRS